MPFDFTDQLESLVQSTGPDDLPEIPAMPTPEVIEPQADSDAQAVAPALPADLMSEAAFHEQFGMVQMRTGAPCPLGDQARGEGGRQASSAIYAMALKNPTLAKLILSTSSTFWGQMAAIGMHGFACVQIIKTSAQAGTQIEHEVSG